MINRISYIVTCVFVNAVNRLLLLASDARREEKLKYANSIAFAFYLVRPNKSKAGLGICFFFVWLQRMTEEQ